MTEPHRFTKGALDRACGMLNLLLSRMEEFERAHGPAARIVLHPWSLQALRDESRRRFDMDEYADRGTFMGTRVSVCQCGDEHAADVLVAQAGKLEIL